MIRKIKKIKNIKNIKNIKTIKNIKNINPRENIKKAGARAKRFQSKFRGHLSTALLTAFALVIALTWKDWFEIFVNSLIISKTIQNSTHFLVQYPTLLKLFLALFITIIGVIGIIIVTKWDKKKEQEEK